MGICECKQYAAVPVESPELALAAGTTAAPRNRVARGTEAWDRAMLEAQVQTENYAHALPRDEDPPPFLLVIDVGHVIELYADFSQKGKIYLPFPDARSHRIRLADLGRDAVRSKLRTLWLDPRSLDPARESAEVTREVAGCLANLAKSFEQRHDPKGVAEFLCRCLFCMFAEDVGLLPKDSFTRFLDSLKADPGAFVPLIQGLFDEMNHGGFSLTFRKKLLAFNGGLFAAANALPVNGAQLEALRLASSKQWQKVEPAIFGTLLERALAPDERHKLGAHYTPRAYVERLVLPTVIEPLREEWQGVRTAAVTLANRGELKKAIAGVRAYHHRLCSVRVLDPACGSGNFLYVALEHMKRLEGEVFDVLGRFGFITTNSIRQTFNRRVVKRALMEGISLRFAIPDHPWVDTSEGAAVRIAMTVGLLGNPFSGRGRVEEAPPDPGAFPGDLLLVTHETPQEDGSSEIAFVTLRGRIGSGLNIGAGLEDAMSLQANAGLSSPGVKLHGSGFIVTPEEAKVLGFGKVKGLEKHIRPYRNGRDLTDRPRGVLVIDLFGLTAEEVRDRFPKVYEHVLRTVKTERDQNSRASYRKLWWIHGEPRRDFRPALAGLSRYIATFETGKHRFFQFLEAAVLPDNMLIAVASDDAFHLGVLSSRIHVVYALAAGGRLGYGNDPRYNKTHCFDPFPFPDCTEKQKARIRKLAEELDAHRKRAQEKHGLGLTDIYNVLEKVRAVSAPNVGPALAAVPRSTQQNGPATSADPTASEPGNSPSTPEPLTPKERAVHEAAMVSTLRQLHDELDRAVADAYGWPWPLSDEEILERVVVLNAARATEEANGNIRWLRSEYQKPLFAGEKQSTLGLADMPDSESGTAKKPKAPAKGKTAWPTGLADRVRAVEVALAGEEKPASAAELAKRFARARPADVAEILQTLVTLGRARPGDAKGTFVK